MWEGQNYAFLDIHATKPFLTPVDQFYYKNGAEISIARWTMPVIDQNAWRLTIDGLVSTPQSISFQDILAEESSRVELLKTMRCVIDSNEVQGLIGTAVWSGIPLRLFLDRAGVDLSKTRRLRLYGDDGFTNNIPISRMYGTIDPDLAEPLLVTHINGQPLPNRHGFPVRLIVHESFGYKNVKWLTRIEATAEDTAFGTYQDKGFADDGEMRVVSRMTDPIDNITVQAGTVRCVGFAVSGSGGIGSVEISVDGGPFAPATLMTHDELFSSDPLLADTVQYTHSEFSFPLRGVWTLWSFEYQLPAGQHQFRIRATDTQGNVQPGTDTDLSDGINAIPIVTVTAV